MGASDNGYETNSYCKKGAFERRPQDSKAEACTLSMTPHLRSYRLSVLLVFFALFPRDFTTRTLHFLLPLFSLSTPQSGQRGEQKAVKKKKEERPKL